MARTANPPLPALWLMLLALLGVAYASELDELGDEFLEYLGSLEGEDDNWTDIVAVNATRSASSSASSSVPAVRASAASSASSKSTSTEARAAGNTASKTASKTAGKVEP